MTSRKAYKNRGGLGLLDTSIPVTGPRAAHDFRAGDGATLMMYSDQQAHTVLKVTRLTVTIRRDKATLMNGVRSEQADALTFQPGGFCGHTSGAQRWVYEPDPEGQIRTAHYRPSKGGFYADGCRLVMGRHEHYDYNF